MTICYAEDLATAQDLSVFWKILFLWKGSIYKIIWPNMLLYISCYGTLSFSYRMMMTDTQRGNFEYLVLYIRTNVDKIQVPFFLGFFVTQVYNRWWAQFFTLPWPDACAVSLAGCINSVGRSAREARRGIIRYAVLGFTLLLRTMCLPVANRFKRREKLVDHGYLTEDELFELRRLRLDDEFRPNWTVALQWSAILAAKARDDKSIASEEELCLYLDVLSSFTEQLMMAYVVNWINIPMCYTQVVTLVVYVYYFAQMIAQQYLLPKDDCLHQDEDYYFPLYLFTQFFFFMGWLKTAEVLINPYGEDDDDLDINWLIDRNFEMTVLADDILLSEQPKRLFDWYWSQRFADEGQGTGGGKEAAGSKLGTDVLKLKKAKSEIPERRKVQDKKSNLLVGKQERYDLRTRKVVDTVTVDELELPEFEVNDLKEASSDVEEYQVPFPLRNRPSPVNIIETIKQQLGLGLVKTLRKTSTDRGPDLLNKDLQQLEMFASLTSADMDLILGQPVAVDDEEFGKGTGDFVVQDAGTYFDAMDEEAARGSNGDPFAYNNSATATSSASQ